MVVIKQSKNTYTSAKLTKVGILLTMALTCVFSWLESPALANTSQDQNMGTKNDYRNSNIKNEQNIFYDGIDYSKRFLNNSFKTYPITKSAKYYQKRKELDKLSRKLNVLEEDEDIVTFYITGIPGSGKTELAKSYAREHKGRYSFVRVFDAESIEGLQKGFESLAEDINKEEFNKLIPLTERMSSIDAKDIKKIKEIIKKTIHFILGELEGLEKRWLWIFDNVKDYDQIEDYIPSIEGVEGTVFITKQTRHSDVDEMVDLNNGMDEDEAVDLLYKIAGVKIDEDMLGTKEDALNLVGDLNCLPLAISVSALYIRNVNEERKERSNALITFNEYKELLNDEVERVKLEEREADYRKENSNKFAKYKFTQAIAIRLLIERLSKEELVILKLCGFINANHIPRWLLEEYLRFELPDVEFSEYKLEKLVKKHPLLSPESYGEEGSDYDLFFVHRETQMQVRRIFVEQGYGHMVDFFGRIPLPIPQPPPILIPYSWIDVLNDHITIKRLAQLRPHLDSLINHKDYIKENTKALVLSILENIDRTLNRVKESCDIDWAIPSRYGSAEKSCFAGIGAMEAIGDVGSSFTIAENLKNLGKLEANRGLFDKAKDYFEQALSKLSGLSDDSNKVKKLKAKIYCSLAGIYFSEDSSEKSLESVIKALNILGAENLFYQSKKLPIAELAAAIVETRSIYGKILALMGRYNEAGIAFKEAIYLIKSFADFNDLDVSLPMKFMNPLVQLSHAEMIFRVINVREKEMLENIEFYLGSFIPERANRVSSQRTPFYDYYPFYKIKAHLLRIEIRIKLGRLNDAYKDCQKMFEIEDKIGSDMEDCYCDYNLAHYHAAVVKYKQGDLEKCLEHISSFSKKVGYSFDIDAFKDSLLKKVYPKSNGLYLRGKNLWGFDYDYIDNQHNAVITGIRAEALHSVGGYTEEYADKLVKLLDLSVEISEYQSCAVDPLCFIIEHNVNLITLVPERYKMEGMM